MKKQGLLYQGLPMFPLSSTSMIKEENSYLIESNYINLTYFIAYLLSANTLCQNAVIDIQSRRQNELLKKVEESSYKSKLFWNRMLKNEKEKLCGACVIGLLETIRHCNLEEEKMAEIGFWNLLCRGFHKEYGTWIKRRACSQKIRLNLSSIFIQNYEEKELKLCSWICINMIMAEKLDVILAKDDRYAEFCKHLSKFEKLFCDF